MTRSCGRALVQSCCCFSYTCSSIAHTSMQTCESSVIAADNTSIHVIICPQHAPQLQHHRPHTTRVSGAAPLSANTIDRLLRRRCTTYVRESSSSADWEQTARCAMAVPPLSCNRAGGSKQIATMQIHVHCTVHAVTRMSGKRNRQRSGQRGSRPLDQSPSEV